MPDEIAPIADRMASFLESVTISDTDKMVKRAELLREFRGETEEVPAPAQDDPPAS